MAINVGKFRERLYVQEGQRYIVVIDRYSAVFSHQRRQEFQTFVYAFLGDEIGKDQFGSLVPSEPLVLLLQSLIKRGSVAPLKVVVAEVWKALFEVLGGRDPLPTPFLVLHDQFGSNGVAFIEHVLKGSRKGYLLQVIPHFPRKSHHHGDGSTSLQV